MAKYCKEDLMISTFHFVVWVNLHYLITITLHSKNRSKIGCTSCTLKAYQYAYEDQNSPN